MNTDPNDPKTYTYTVIWMDDRGDSHEVEYGHFEKEQALSHYHRLPADWSKALYQTWREPTYGEQCMLIHYPKGIK